MHRIRRHLSYANVVSTLCLILLLGGGTALASVIITKNSQVDSGTISGHKPPHGDHANIIAGSISGKDIADRSGVDTCKTPLLAKFGPICAGSDGVTRTWNNAIAYCSSFGLRLPTYSEAQALARNYDVPGVSGSDFFWTDDGWSDGAVNRAYGIGESGNTLDDSQSGINKTVCVTDPSA
jgi:hypothetical protein